MDTRAGPRSSEIGALRLMLVAMECAKGDVALNLAAHLGVLEEAARQRCHVAVFPEFSLTGSVAALAHPDRAVTAGDEHVARLVEATHRTGVAAVFGIGERATQPVGELYITQIAAAGGAIVGVQRKRHIAEDEVGFAAGTLTAAFDVAGHRLGIVICAESTVDFTWQATVDAGADVVLFCSAPGLYGRRSSDDEWAAGVRWWESAGLADAQRQAAAHGVWVAMATQAGSTVDEDFPGIAALVDPSGEVVSRTDGRVPGFLVVEIRTQVGFRP